MYDVVVVGGRCAGAATAMQLARGGCRVLLLDRAQKLGNALSTHFLWPRGASYLADWGVLDAVLAVTPSGREVEIVMEGVALRGEVPLAAIAERHRGLHGAAADTSRLTNQLCSVRRQILDPLLLEAAAQAGVDVALGHGLVGLERDGDRVTGVRFRDPSGTIGTESARLVVGADGRRSATARHLELQPYDIRQKCTFAVWTYFTGFRPERPTLCRRGRLGFAVVPTNDDVNMTLVWGPAEWYAAFQTNRERHYFEAMRFVAPQLYERISSESERVEKFYGTDEQAAFCRPDHGPGWALVGDAACVKDQCTAIGMTHAFRDAALLAQHAVPALAGDMLLDDALDRYAALRYRDHTDYYEFVCMQAEMKPLQDQEMAVLAAASKNEQNTSAFLAAFSDTIPIRRFFSRSSRQRLMRALRETGEEAPKLADDQVDAYYDNPFTEAGTRHPDALALNRLVVDFARPRGRDLLQRAEDYHRWVQARIGTSTWTFTRYLDGPPLASAAIEGEDGRRVQGVNLASQDYLSLSSHPDVHDAARRALRNYGPHSAGSPMLVGNTNRNGDLEQAIGELLATPHVALFPTGWAAGFGTVAALVRDEDYILMDKYAHACLQQGAYAATRNVLRYQHLDCDTARYWLEDVRARDPHAGILVVTEGLFSMDSDTPDLRKLQALCREYDATLMVDVAHDLGAMGPGGTGAIGGQGLLGEIDVVMGSFSKTFASNGGFVATRSAAVREYIRMYASTHTFSNALSPMQVAVIREAFRIVSTPEGEVLRQQLATAVSALRQPLDEGGATVLGDPSPIVPVLIGDERVARIAYRMLLEREICGNVVEYPGVASGMARFRLQVMAAHSPEQMAAAARAVLAVLHEAHAHVGKVHHLEIPARTFGRAPHSTPADEAQN